MTKLETFEFISPEEWRFLENDEVQANSQRADEYAQKNFRLENLEQRVEEFVRQWIIRKLIEVYGYPENWLELELPYSPLINLVIKDGKGAIRALIAAKFLGESDADFEKACQDMQDELDNRKDAFFALLTDGKHLIFLRKNDGESINDLNAIADFPTFSELEFFIESGEQPTLPIVSGKFFKLSPPKKPLITEPPAPPIELSVKESPPVKKPLVAPKSQADNQFFDNRSASETKSKSGKALAIAVGIVILCLFGAWFSGIFGTNQNSKVQPTTTKVQIEDGSGLSIKPNALKSSGKSLATAPVSTSPRSSQKTAGIDAPSQSDDGTVKLNDKDIAIMRSSSISKSKPDETKDQKQSGQQSETEGIATKKKKTTATNQLH